MERTRERLAIAQQALATLEELVGKSPPVSKVVRDAAIQRFEYTFEAVWKAVQLYLKEVEGLEVGSPKGAVRASLRVGVLGEDDARFALAMADDRNLTVHTYNEALAEAIYGRLVGYARLMDRWIGAMMERMGEL